MATKQADKTTLKLAFLKLCLERAIYKWVCGIGFSAHCWWNLVILDKGPLVQLLAWFLGPKKSVLHVEKLLTHWRR